MYNFGEPITIIGAGPGGLIAARMLERAGIPVAVYDADESLASRDLGGSLDLHADTGQIALEEADLSTEFQQLARPEDQAKRMADSSGNILGSFTPDDGDLAAPEIDRGQLRVMLAESVSSAVIHWGHRLRTIGPVESGERTLRFDNGVTLRSELVIGADGVDSVVRPILTDAVAGYAGIAFVDVTFDEANTRHPEVAELTGTGHLFSRDGDGRGVILQRNSNGVIRGYVAFAAPEDWAERAGISRHDTQSIRDYLADEFAGWGPTFRSAIAQSDSYVARRIRVLPAPLTWDRIPGATLLGDAAHVMSPFGGYGVNLALLDGAELARAIISEPAVESALDVYETEMFQRSGPLAVAANQALIEYFAEGDHQPPDTGKEHDDYRSNAENYRAARANPGA